MTKLPAMFGQLKDFDKFFVGFDDTYNRLAKMHDELTKSVPNYPPYNIRKTGDNSYVIELAVAGFSKSEIEILIEEDKLTVKGAANDVADATDYLFKGIGLRDFTRTFALNDQVEVKGAGMFNGMLRIALERIIPEHKKPQKVEISDEPSTVQTPAKRTKGQLLQEDIL